jgi:hypothetical protein
MEHIVQWCTKPFSCPSCTLWGFGFNSMLFSHLHNISKRSSQTIQVLRNGKLRVLSWGCGKDLSERESSHEHLDSCQECQRGRLAVEDILGVVAFEQLTDLWACVPSIVLHLDKLLGRNGVDDEGVWKDNPLRLLRLLHEQIKEDRIATRNCFRRANIHISR